MSIIDKIPSEILAVVAGVAGAVAGLAGSTGKKPHERVVFFASGVFCAAFLTEYVAYLYEIPEKFYGAVGFVLGASGGAVISAVTERIKSLNFLKGK